MRAVRILGGLLLVIAMLAGVAWWVAGRWTPPRDAYAIQGIDVSDANGAIDWAMVRARDVDFAYARATIGADRRDARFDEYWSGLTGAGIRRGAVHGFSLCARADAQAGAYAAMVPRDPAALPAAIDLDFDEACPARPAREVVLDQLRELASIIETHSGKPVILRLSPAFEREYRVSEAIPRPLWAMRDFREPDYMARPWRLWRSNDLRRVDGIDGPVNWNVVAP